MVDEIKNDEDFQITHNLLKDKEELKKYYKFSKNILFFALVLNSLFVILFIIWGFMPIWSFGFIITLLFSLILWLSFELLYVIWAIKTLILNPSINDLKPITLLCGTLSLFIGWIPLFGLIPIIVMICRFNKEIYIFE